jgi:hypothetical protein
VDELHALDIDMTYHKLVSFDVTSLFTNVPLKETIKIVLAELYGDTCHCPIARAGEKEVVIKNDEKCRWCLDRLDLEWLLQTATSRTHFLFNGKIFSQINGVAMGSPIGPLLADIFMVHLEKQLMERLERLGVVYSRRYVDDTLAIVKIDADTDQLKSVLNSFHPSIQFTIELEDDSTIPFLDILIRRHPRVTEVMVETQQHEEVNCVVPSSNDHTNQHHSGLPKHQHQSDKRPWFSTSVYRKPTFTGLILKWNSYVPLEYKRSAISSMVYRAIRITSNFPTLHKEFLFIRQIAVSNGYPLSFVLRVIRTTLNKHLYGTPELHNNPKQTAKPKIGQGKQVIMVDIPFVGRPTATLGKKLVNLAKQLKSNVHVQPIPRPSPSIQSLFARKDPIPKQLLSNVVYNITCNDCPAAYIGKTCRQVSRRFKEHRQVQSTSTHSRKCRRDPTLTTQTVTTTMTTNVRRSKRTKCVVNYAQLDKGLDPVTEISLSNNKTIESAIHEHVVETGHSINWDDWALLGKDRKYYPLLVRESIYITNLQPSLNRTMSSVPLVVYPDVSSIIKPKVKMK